MWRRTLRAAGVVVLALGVSDAFAWNGTGHETVASIAWQNMSTAARDKASALLRKHPRFQEDLLRGMRDDEDQDEYAFRMAATWPDMVRSTSNPLSATWHKAKWHYIDFGFSVDGTKVPDAPSETFTAGQEPENASQAIQWANERINSASAQAIEKAIAMCWMLHLIGDIHQPLHCSTLFSERFKKGDRGGNSFSVTEPEKEHATNLHSLWDGAFGSSETTMAIQRIATSATRAHPRSDFGATIGSLTDLSRWIHDSATEAKEIAYGSMASSDSFPVDLTTEYMSTLKDHAQKKAALGGYRLAEILNAWAGEVRINVTEASGPTKEEILDRIARLQQQVDELKHLVEQMK